MTACIHAAWTRELIQFAIALTLKSAWSESKPCGFIRSAELWLRRSGLASSSVVKEAATAEQ